MSKSIAQPTTQATTQATDQATSQAITELDRDRVTALLGREPRGLRAIPARRPEGDPMVIQVASLVAGKPFPTLYWLVDPALNYDLDRLEASGAIAQLQQQIDADTGLQSAMAADHRKHIEQRNALMSPEDRRLLQEKGFFDALQNRGIGGIEKTARVRCLHTWYAAHLVESNTVGALVDHIWEREDRS